MANTKYCPFVGMWLSGPTQIGKTHRRNARRQPCADESGGSERPPDGKGETLCLGTPGTGQIAWGQSPKNKETMVRAADLELPTSVGKYPVSLDRHVCPLFREGLDLPKNVCHQINDSDPVCPDGVLSRWPIDCLAYGPALKLLLKPAYKERGHGRALKRQLLMRVHFVLSGRLGANNHNLSSTTAQLCWQKRNSCRRVAGHAM